MQVAVKDEIKAIYDHIADAIGEAKFKVWFKNSTRFTLTEQGLEIAVGNSFIASWIENHFAKTILNAIRAVKNDLLAINFVIDSTLISPSHKAAPAKHGSIVTIDDLGARKEFNPPLKLTLDSFVVGEKNNLAYNAAKTIISEEKSPYNPLFYHGGYGIGKTHLMQGICNEFARLRSNAKWMYLSAEDFANQYVLSLKTKKLDVFRNRFRNLDLLAIDDIHFLANKNAMQEEFLHTFNSIDMAGKQIVLASDAHPKQIDQLCEKLVSRFVSGMVIRMDPPDFETRCEICRRKTLAMKQKISEDVVEFIAGQISANVRELEGALLKLIAFTSISGNKINLAMARELLSEHITRNDPVVHTSDITSAVAHYFNVSSNDIHSAKKDRSISLARSFCMYLTRRLTRMSFPEIGKTLGDKNHATVILACRKIEQAIESNKRLQWKVESGYRNASAKDIFQELMEQIS